jgi:hypothetical protein
MIQLNLINDLLRNRKEFVERSLTVKPDRNELLMLTAASIFFYAFYGLIIGANHGVLQAAISAVKLPCLFLMTSLICFPALYFFLAILGIKQTVGQLLTFILTCLSIMSIVLVVFAPISLFFLITSNSYPFYLLINVAIFSMAGITGLYLFYKNLSIAIQTIPDEINQGRAYLFLKLWLLLFAFIGCQLSYSLSPFFGDPSQPFILFTKVHSNFYVEVIRSFSKL